MEQSSWNRVFWQEDDIEDEGPSTLARRVGPVAGAILLLFSVDRLSKLWVQGNMEIGSSIPIVSDLVTFSFYVNRGAPSGFGQHWPLTAPLLAVAGLVFIPIMVLTYHFYARSHGESFWSRSFLATGLAAVIATVVDRIQYGYVIDFIFIRSLPIINIADLFPPISAFALMMEMAAKGRSLFFGPRRGIRL